MRLVIKGADHVSSTALENNFNSLHFLCTLRLQKNHVQSYFVLNMSTGLF